MKISIIGGGNIGTLTAALLSTKGHEVVVYTSRPTDWNEVIEVYNSENELLYISGAITATDDLEFAVKKANIVLVTYPAQLHFEFAVELNKYITENTVVGIMPGTGGVEFAYSQLIDRGIVVFGLQRVHAVSRLKEYGRSVYALGGRDILKLASIPSEKGEDLAPVVSSLLDVPCEALPNYLSVTLTPSNPILHTTRLFSMFKDNDINHVYERQFLFYEEWNDSSSRILIECDEELQNLCNVIPLDLSTVRSLKEHYEGNTPNELTNTIKGIKAFKGLKAPMVQQGDGWVVDVNNRYFSTDFPYGLKVIKDIADCFGVKTPSIDKVWNWYVEFNKCNLKTYFELQLTRDELIEKYI